MSENYKESEEIHQEQILPFTRFKKELENFAQEEGVKIEFEDSQYDSCTLHVSIPESIRNAIITPENEEDISLQKQKFIRRLQKSAEACGMELTFRGSGPFAETYRAFPKLREEKTNWRRWVTNPEALSDKMSDILDEIGTFEEIREKVDALDTDSYGKFNRYIRLAHGMGLINEKEFKDIENRINDAIRY